MSKSMRAGNWNDDNCEDKRSALRLAWDLARQVSHFEMWLRANPKLGKSENVNMELATTF